jgi:hypothetical protein
VKFRLSDALNAGPAAGGTGFYHAHENAAGIKLAGTLAARAGDDLRSAGHIETVCALQAASALRAMHMFIIQFMAAVRAVIHQTLPFRRELFQTGAEFRRREARRQLQVRTEQ